MTANVAQPSPLRKKALAGTSVVIGSLVGDDPSIDPVAVELVLGGVLAKLCGLQVAFRETEAELCPLQQLNR